MEVVIQNLIETPELSVSLALTVYMVLTGIAIYYLCARNKNDDIDL